MNITVKTDAVTGSREVDQTLLNLNVFFSFFRVFFSWGNFFSKGFSWLALTYWCSWFWILFIYCL